MSVAEPTQPALPTAPAVVRESGDLIVREVLSFLADQPQSDDMCLVSWGLLTNVTERTVDIRALGSDTSSMIR